MGEKKQNTLVNIINVTLSNIIALLSGVAIGFLVPKIMEVETYGYYKTFSLYISYVGFFGVGVAEGIYLLFAGKNIDDIPKGKIKQTFRILLLIEIALMGIISLISIFLSTAYRIIGISFAINVVAATLIMYFQFLSQATERFTEYSIVNIVKSVITIVLVVALFAWYMWFGLSEVKFYYVILITVVTNYILTFIYIFLYRKYLFGKDDREYDKNDFVAKVFKYGIPLLISNLVCSLLLTIDRQFVNILFDKEEYGIYAFAYNMLALITTATSAISVVIYPIMLKSDENGIKDDYPYLSSIVSTFVFGCLVAYFPLYLIVVNFLSKYSDSMPIFRIIFPALVVQSVISIVMQNNFKKLNKNMIYFYVSLFILIMSIVANIIAYLIFKSTEAISIASVIVSFMWYIILQAYFIKKYHISWIKDFIYIILTSVAFYLSTAIDSIYIAGAMYISIYIGLTLLFNFKNIKKLLLNFLKRSSNEENKEIEE